MRNLEKPQVRIIKWKKPVWNGYMLCVSNYTFQKIQNYGDSGKISGCQGLGGGGEEEREK